MPVEWNEARDRIVGPLLYHPREDGRTFDRDVHEIEADLSLALIDVDITDALEERLLRILRAGIAMGFEYGEGHGAHRQRYGFNSPAPAPSQEETNR
jgi:hypothetical protein